MTLFSKNELNKYLHNRWFGIVDHFIDSMGYDFRTFSERDFQLDCMKKYIYLK